MTGTSSRVTDDGERAAEAQRPAAPVAARAAVPPALAAAAPFLAAGNAAAAAFLGAAPPRRALSRKDGDEGAKPAHTLDRSEETGEVDTPSGTIYATPDAKGEEVASLPQGTQVKVHGLRDGEWYAVDADGKSGWMSVMELAVTRGENAPARAAVNLDDWLAVIPDAKLRGDLDPKKIKGKSSHEHALGKLGAFDETGDTGVGKFGYRKDAKGELAEAGAAGAGITQTDIDSAVEKVKSARAAVQQRYIGGAGSGNDYAGLATTPQGEENAAARDKKKWEADEKKRKKEGLEPTAAPESKGADASTAYKAWLNQPTTVPKALADPEDMNWKAFRRIFDWEGFPSAVQTYDQANITFGVGFAGVQAEELLQRILAKSGDAKAALHTAGVAQAGTTLIVVDIDRKWVLRGTDAELYLRDNKELISLFVNIFQGTMLDAKEPAKVNTDMRQQVLDANWEQFAARTMSGMAAPAKGSDVDLWALKLHTRHAGNYVPVAKLMATTTIDQTIELIYDTTSKTIADTIVLPPSWRAHGHEFLAKKAAAPAPPVARKTLARQNKTEGEAETLDPSPDALAGLKTLNPFIQATVAKSSPTEFLKGLRAQFNNGVTPATKADADRVDKEIIAWYASYKSVMAWKGSPFLHPIAADRLTQAAALVPADVQARAGGFYQNATTSGSPGVSVHGVGLAIDLDPQDNPMINDARTQELLKVIGDGEDHNMSLPDGQKAIGEMGKDKDKPGTSTLEEATMERIHDETKRMHETSDKLKSTLVTEKFPDPVAKLAELKAKVADPKTKKEAMAELKELLAPWYKLIEARRAAVKDDPKELALLKKLEDALGDSSFIFKAEGHVDPGAEQLVRRGYFNLNEVTIKGLAKCGWYPGACYGGAFDGMHFRLADPLLPGPGKHATKK